MIHGRAGARCVPPLLLGALLGAPAHGAAEPAVRAAAGRVTDLHGHAVAGVLVKAESWESEPLGSARTDAQGRFRVPLSQPVKDLTLVVEHPGFQRWARAGMGPGETGYAIRLTRTIDRRYLTELAAQAQPARFRELARDLLAPSKGTVGDTLPLQEILPFLQGMRARLSALLPAEPAKLERLDLTGEQHNAALLLAYLGDPRDDALLDAWTAAARFIARPPKPCRGATAEAAARAWQKVHFESEGYRDGQPRPYSFLEVQIAPSGDHGLARHTVRYAHWGYSQHLVLVHRKDAWEVRRVIEGRRWHGPPQ